MFVHTHPTIFGNWEFFLFSLCPHVNGATGTINTVFKKRSPEWIFASIILDSSLIVDGRKTEVFEFDNVIHHILLALRILCKGCYRNSIVLAFSSAFCFVSFQVFLINTNHFTGFLNLLFCVERPLAIMICLVLLLLIPLCFANDEISNNEVSYLIKF